MRDDHERVIDIIEAIERIEKITSKGKRVFYDDEMVQVWVIHHLQIIGEAAWRLAQPLKDQHPQIPWRLIAGMRHAIVHDYFEIDWNEVWNTATRDVPALRPLIDVVLQSLPPDQP